MAEVMNNTTTRKQIAIVTGASRGIGREFVYQIAEKYSGFDEIWVIARRFDLLYSLSKEITNVKIVPFPMDLSDPEEIEKLDIKLCKSRARVRLLVNCAGYGKLGAFCDKSFSSEIGMIDVNCRALTAITHTVLKYMPSRSRIINLASAAAFFPQKNFAVYAASKAYVDSFSMGLRKELWKEGISVTSVCPGPVDTDFFTIADPENKTNLLKKLTMVKKEKVVKYALECASKSKARSIYSPAMKAGYLLSHLLP